MGVTNDISINHNQFIFPANKHLGEQIGIGTIFLPTMHYKVYKSKMKFNLEKCICTNGCVLLTYRNYAQWQHYTCS